MIAFLYGQDIYRLRQKLRELINDFEREHKNCSLIKHFDAKDLDFESFRNEIQTSSIFKEKKLITIGHVFSNSIFLEKTLKFFNENREKTENTLLFWEEKKIDPDHPLIKEIARIGKVYKFDLLSEAELKRWIRREFGKYKVEIEPGIIEALWEFGGNDLWLISGEIKKLIAFAGKSKKVSLKDLKLLSKPEVETDIFTTLDAISSDNKKRALDLLHNHLKKGESPLYLFSMLKKQISNLLIVKDLRNKRIPSSFIAQESKLHPFVVKKCLRLSEKFTFEQLKKIYWKIFQYEIKIKTGKIDPVLALELLTIEI